MRLVDADKEIEFYKRRLYNPTPDVSESDRWHTHAIINALERAATVESRPKGKWIVSKKDSNYNCSVCGCNPRKSFRASSLEWIREINGCDMQYCPWCGAEMEGKNDNV